MVDVEIIATGEILEVIDQKITYIKRVGDIGDILAIASSYSRTMKFPRTPNNTKIFKGLGIKGHTSNFPYTKNYCNIRDNGIAIVNKGILNVTNVGDDYKVFIQDGIIDFLKDVGVDKIGETIDLSELNHTNDVGTIIASFTQDTFRYIIASYNGTPLPNELGITNISPTALIPSINCQWLWNAIFDYYGWTYTGSVDFNNLWMTYPNALVFDDSTATQMLLGTTEDDIADLQYPLGYIGENGKRFMPFLNKTINNDFFEYVLGSENTKFRCLVSGNYKITFGSTGFVRYEDYYGTQNDTYWVDSLYVNSSSVINGTSSYEDTDTEIQLTLQTGDIIFIVSTASKHDIDTLFYITEAHISIDQLGVQDVSFSQALINYKTRDYFKELMFRGSLTAFTDIDNKNIHFMTLDERLNGQVVDWSEKYISRKDESYVYDSYAQNNYVRHKYDEDGDDYDDGNLTVTNDNLDIEKSLYDGNGFAPLQELVEYQGTNFPSYFVSNFKMFDVEIKEDVDTSTVFANYKPLKNRFYFMESEARVDDLYILGQLVQEFPIASITNTRYRTVISQKYSQFNKLVDNTKIQEIELSLSKFDVATLDLKKVYYFEQEKAYYLLNSLKWESGKSTGEFIRIRR